MVDTNCFAYISVKYVYTRTHTRRLHFLVTYQCKDKKENIYYVISNITKCNAYTIQEINILKISTGKLTTAGHSPKYCFKKRKLHTKSLLLRAAHASLLQSVRRCW